MTRTEAIKTIRDAVEAMYSALGWSDAGYVYKSKIKNALDTLAAAYPQAQEPDTIRSAVYAFIREDAPVGMQMMFDGKLAKKLTERIIASILPPAPIKE